MKKLSVFVLAAIMVFAVALSAQTTSDTPSDQPQASEMQQDQSQAPATELNNGSAVADETSAAESVPSIDSAPIGEVSAENGAWILDKTPSEPQKFSAPSDEVGQDATTTRQSFPDLYY